MLEKKKKTDKFPGHRNIFEDNYVLLKELASKDLCDKSLLIFFFFFN